MKFFHAIALIFSIFVIMVSSKVNAQRWAYRGGYGGGQQQQQQQQMGFGGGQQQQQQQQQFRGRG